MTFVAALALQALAFRAFGEREILTAFPRMYDQTAYLGIAQDIYQRVLDRGLLDGLRTSSFDAPQGVLLQYEGAAAYLLLGQSRMSALWINFLHFAAFQTAFFALSWWVGRAWLGFMVCGLLASAAYLFRLGGGMFDFRLDFAAFCLMGMLICLVVRSGGFRDRRWSLAVGLAGGVMALTRTITLAYTVPAVMLLLVLLPILGRWWRIEAPRRVVNILLASATTLAISAPSLLSRARSMVNYYVIGHGVSSEKEVRAAELGLHNVFDHAFYYPRSVLLHHGGVTFWSLGLLAVLVLAVVWFLSRKSPPDVGPTRPALTRLDLLVVALFIGALTSLTYVILTVDVAKSPVVGSVFLVFGVSWLWLFGFVVTEGRTWRDRAPGLWGSWTAVAIAVFLAGQLTFVSRAVARSEMRLPPEDMQEYLGLVDTVGSLSAHLGLASPTVSFDEITEYFHVSVFRALAFERLGLNLHPRAGLGAIQIGLGAIDRREAEAQVLGSDFAILGRDRDGTGPASAYPLNRALASLSTHLYELAQQHLVPVRDAAFFGRQVTLFMKPLLSCTGNDAGWVTAEGIECRTAGAALQARRSVEIKGTVPLPYLGALPSLRARVLQDGQVMASTICDGRLESGTTTPDGRYIFSCELSGVPLPSAPVDVQLDFDRHFVPKDLKLNEDTRQLVTPWPEISLSVASPMAAPAQPDRTHAVRDGARSAGAQSR